MFVFNSPSTNQLLPFQQKKNQIDTWYTPIYVYVIPTFHTRSDLKECDWYNVVGWWLETKVL